MSDCNQDKCEPRLRAIEDAQLVTNGKLDKYNDLLAIHIEGVQTLKKEVAESREHREDVLKIVVKQAEQARKDNIKVIGVCIGVFTALAGLVTALAAWLSSGG